MDRAVLLEEVGYVMSLIKLELRKKLEIQGYGTLGNSKLQQTMDYEIKAVSTLIVATMLMEDYYVFVEEKTEAANIPFGGRTGKKTSKYIQGLWRYWRLKRGLGVKEALRASFATARVHKREGRPSRNSFRYSKDGTRLAFIDSTLKAMEASIAESLSVTLGKELEIALTQILKSGTSTRFIRFTE